MNPLYGQIIALSRQLPRETIDDAKTRIAAMGDGIVASPCSLEYHATLVVALCELTLSISKMLLQRVKHKPHDPFEGL